jgi:hypothetical protein
MLARIGRLLTLAVVAATTAGGCASYSAPSLRVTDVRCTEETSEGLALAFTLMARNDNDVALPLRAVEYELLLGGPEQGSDLRRVFRGTRSPEASLRQRGEQPIVLPAVVPLRDGAPRPTGVRRYRLWTRLTYITPGALAEVMFDTGVRRPVVTIESTGMLDFGEGPGSSVSLLDAAGSRGSDQE